MKILTKTSETRSLKNHEVETELMNYAELLTRGLIYLGKRRVIKHGNRYIISLPHEMAELWKELSEAHQKIEIYIKATAQQTSNKNH